MPTPRLRRRARPSPARPSTPSTLRFSTASMRPALSALRNRPAAISPGVIFQLPPGYRPANQEAFADDNSDSFGRVDVTTNGFVCARTTTPVSGFATLDGITFRADH